MEFRTGESPLQPIRRILVAVKDPGAERLPAVSKAIQLARAFGGELELFHAIASPIYVDMLALTESNVDQVEREELTQYRQRLERIAARARLHTKPVSVATAWDYPVYEAIVRRAAEIGADLVVAERHTGRHRAAGVLRLTDWELLRLCPVPVLLVKRPRPYHAPRVLTAVDPDHAAGKTAQLDEAILAAGALVAGGLRGELHVVHACLPAPNRPVTGAETVPATLDKTLFEQGLRRWHIPPEHRHLLAGDPSDVIAAIARRVGADIVVAGALSRSGLQRLLIGNTAERLLDELSCDLLIVKPAEFACPVPLSARGAHRVSAQPPC
jgi:universal stress protein E